MRAEREKIVYGIYDVSFSDAAMMIARSDIGLCWLGFMSQIEDGAYKGDSVSRLHAFYSGADIARDDGALLVMRDEVLCAWERGSAKGLSLDLRGSDFQKAVWHALLDIPRGALVSYGDIAAAIGRPKAARAVGTAVGDNPVSLVVPCHRVVRGNGGLGNYGWGLPVKAQILEAEGAL